MEKLINELAKLQTVNNELAFTEELNNFKTVSYDQDPEHILNRLVNRLTIVWNEYEGVIVNNERIGMIIYKLIHKQPPNFMREEEAQFLINSEDSKILKAYTLWEQYQHNRNKLTSTPVTGLLTNDYNISLTDTKLIKYLNKMFSDGKGEGIFVNVNNVLTSLKSLQGVYICTEDKCQKILEFSKNKSVAGLTNPVLKMPPVSASSFLKSWISKRSKLTNISDVAYDYTAGLEEGMYIPFSFIQQLLPSNPNVITMRIANPTPFDLLAQIKDQNYVLSVLGEYNTKLINNDDLDIKLTGEDIHNIRKRNVQASDEAMDVEEDVDLTNVREGEDDVEGGGDGGGGDGDGGGGDGDGGGGDGDGGGGDGDDNGINQQKEGNSTILFCITIVMIVLLFVVGLIVSFMPNKNKPRETPNNF